VGAVIIEVQVDPAREHEARKMLVEMIVPRARSREGFSAGFWLRSHEANVIRAVQVYDTEATARAAAEEIRSEGAPPGAPVSLVSIETYEVLANA
jgi:hypothetical protein